MTDERHSSDGHRLYESLAAWWPLISPVEDYEEEAAYASSLLRSASIPVRHVLELGSGGGNNAAHLKAAFEMTLVDLSPSMLAVSQRLNPECEHHLGDMRTVRLGRLFDAVFVHDAVDYMTTEDDLRAAFATAFAHCRPGGVAVFLPDQTTEIFQPGDDHGGRDGADGTGARLLEWTFDPDPADTWALTVYVVIVRHADGRVEVTHETHRTGLFDRETWLRWLREAGFAPRLVREETSEDRVPRDVFVGHRPP